MAEVHSKRSVTMANTESLIEQIQQELEKLPKENIVKVRDYIMELKQEKKQQRISEQKTEGDPILEYIERVNKMDLPSVSPLSSKDIDEELYGETK